MIDVFKIANNMYDASSVVLPFDKSHTGITRGNCFKLSNQRFYHDIRKYSFIPRIINIWNSLPDFVVNVDSINIFKSRLAEMLSRPGSPRPRPDQDQTGRDRDRDQDQGGRDQDQDQDLKKWS